MKFAKLVGKFEKQFHKQSQGKRVKPAKLEKLQQLLTDKESRYQARLAATQDPEKRSKLETRLKVVGAQLEKSKTLAVDD